MPDPAPPASSSVSQCMCVIVSATNPSVTSPCRKMTPGIDVPFCSDCEDRHPEESGGNTVTTRPLPHQEKINDR